MSPLSQSHCTSEKITIAMSSTQSHCTSEKITIAMKSILSNSRKHDISFYTSGRIDISAYIARKLSLVPGDVIDIAQEAGEWYLYVKLRSGTYVGRHEGRVWSTSHGKGMFRAQSKAMAHAVLTAAGSPIRLRCPCGVEFERDNRKFITIIHRCSL